MYRFNPTNLEGSTHDYRIGVPCRSKSNRPGARGSLAGNERHIRSSPAHRYVNSHYPEGPSDLVHTAEFDERAPSTVVT